MEEIRTYSSDILMTCLKEKLINFLILVDYNLLFSWKMKFPIYKHIV